MKKTSKILLYLAIIAIVMLLSRMANNKAFGQEYCIPWINNSENQIEMVAMGRYVSVTGITTANLYRHYGMTLTLEYNRLYLVSLAPVIRDEFYSWRVWIDTNIDGVFDESEMIFKADTVYGNIVGQFTLQECSYGNTRMRVMIVDDPSIIDPCADYISGEVEDYDVIFEELTGIKEMETSTNVKIWPNPVTWELNYTGKFIRITDLQGRTMDVRAGNTLDVSGLEAGIYIAYFEGKNIRFIKL